MWKESGKYFLHGHYWVELNKCYHPQQHGHFLKAPPREPLSSH